jgi:hypothetical protein
MFDDKNRYLDKELNPISIREWGKLFEDANYRVVDHTQLWWGGEVSTVWLGLNHQFQPNKPPLIFETMVFDCGRVDLFQDRYTDIETAKLRHKEIVRRFSGIRYAFLAFFYFIRRIHYKRKE